MAFGRTPAVSFTEAATFCGPWLFLTFFAKITPISASTAATSTFAANDSRKQIARFQSLHVRMPYARAKLSIGREKIRVMPAAENAPPLTAPRLTSCLS